MATNNERTSRRPARAARERTAAGARNHAASTGRGAPSRQKAVSAAGSVGEFALRHRIALAVVAAVVLAVAWLYSPAKNYYCAWRDEQALQVQADALNAQNDQTKDEIDRLQTEEGIKDEARKKGYVDPGETALVVTGLDDGSGSQDDSSNSNDPWYLGFCDFIFGYTPSSKE